MARRHQKAFTLEYSQRIPSLIHQADLCITQSSNLWDFGISPCSMANFRHILPDVFIGTFECQSVEKWVTMRKSYPYRC